MYPGMILWSFVNMAYQLRRASREEVGLGHQHARQVLFVVLQREVPDGVLVPDVRFFLSLFGYVLVLFAGSLLFLSPERLDFLEYELFAHTNIPSGMIDWFLRWMIESARFLRPKMSLMSSRCSSMNLTSILSGDLVANRRMVS